MKGLKRFGAAALIGAMAVTTLAGCGGGKTDTQTASNKEGNTSEMYDSDGNWTGETSHIKMTLLTAGTDPVDMQKVQDEVNEISVKKEGVEIEFLPVSIFDAPSTVPMWIGGGEQVDLMACAFTGLSPFIDMNMIEPMEDYLADYAPDLEQMNEDGLGVYDTTSAEHIYGVHPLVSFEGTGGGYMLPTRVLEEAGYSYENWDTITLKDLDEIFTKVKAKYPDSYMGVLGTLPASGYTICNDALGATAASGVLIGTDSTEVVNYFASAEYKEYLDYVHKWYEEGFILKDAATTDASLSDNIKNGTFIGNFTTGNYGLIEANNKDTGEDWTALMFEQPYIASISSAGGTSWTIPVTAAEPEAATRFLNLMMTDPDVTNLLMWGIKDDHYTLNEDGSMTRTANAVNWALPGIHGNQMIMLQESAATVEKDKEWNKKAHENQSKGFGFNYDASNMTSQLTAVQAVITEYQAALETGSADLDKVYPEFLQKLEANGINDIIADKQAQFDEWLAKQ